MKLSISEILQKVSRTQGRNAKIEMLRQNSSPTLNTILKCAFDPNIKFQLPETDPPYKPNDLPDCEGLLYNEIRKMYLFIEGGKPELPQHKREYLFIQMLETVNEDDAKLLLNVKNKRTGYKTITKKLVEEAFPGLI